MVDAVDTRSGAVEGGWVRYATPRGRWVLGVAVLGSAIAFLEATVTNVALPTIARDLGTGVSGLQWVLNGYLLTLAALILLGGSLGDRYGRRRIFIVGVVRFTLASAAYCTYRAVAGTPLRERRDEAPDAAPEHAEPEPVAASGR
jgi:hypothetical protein